MCIDRILGFDSYVSYELHRLPTADLFQTSQPTVSNKRVWFIIELRDDLVGIALVNYMAEIVDENY